ncbi:MAG: 4Fe-4S dicluster domain-containing protein [Desulfarculaceae bacterium]|nr:4Fe-4S dicluster domain-containing protein [Desulfarculaceae bacterium]MCF8073022.1 4Fe-4S dicluster domain-containing protein [Desulfarculaceae bacterium]MCF8101893.1 4Fe-4S dicluster domain-containing protein [Desulfarculaceae bacterium]MCF8115420.1 4Fe-4S dicluster domain-containing protein [Desulfarculaceae bacterium]
MSRTQPQPEAAPALPPPGEALRPEGRWLAEVEASSGVKAGACYGCKKCSNGCPLTFAMDLHPYQAVRLLQLGQMERLESSATVWICASCQTCLTRCPNQVDLPRLMDWLKERLHGRGEEVGEKDIRLFHELFLKGVAKRGRVFEGELMGSYMLRTGGAFGPEAMANARLGLTMLRKGRLKLLPARTRESRWRRALFKKRRGGSHA